MSHTCPRRSAVVEALNCRGRLVHTVAACKDSLVGELLQLIAIITVINKVFRHDEVFFFFSPEYCT